MKGLIVAILPIMLMFAPLVSGSQCGECHSAEGTSPSGNYRFAEPALIVKADGIVRPGEDISIAAVLKAREDYDLLGSNATLEWKHSSELHGSIEADGTYDGRDLMLSFEMEGMAEGILDYDLRISYDVEYEHSTTARNDRASYTRIEKGTILIDDIALRVVPGTIVLEKVGQVLNVTLEAVQDAYDVRIETDLELSAYISVGAVPARFYPGDRIVLPVTLLHSSDLSGHINISWYSNGSIVSFPLRVVITSAESRSRAPDLYHELGKYTGIASLVLLLVGYFTGGTGPSKRYANRLFGNASRRIRFHCQLSYQVLVLSIFHLAVLIYGPFSRADQVLVWQNVLGMVALGIMIVIAVNGILQKRLIRMIGYANWRRIHAWGSYLATSLVIIHALMMGSHFRWVREVIGAV